MMMERLIEVEITEQGTIFEEIELICTMTGFSRRFLIHHKASTSTNPLSCSRRHQNEDVKKKDYTPKGDRWR